MPSFKPITEHEAKKAQEESSRPAYLLKPGECDFEVRVAKDEVSKSSGNEMIKLTLDVWDSDNKKATVFDYLLFSGPFAFKARHAAYAVGLGHLYESGNISADNFVGKGGRLKIRNRQQQGYDPKNEVADYVIADATRQQPGYKQAKAEQAGVANPPTSPRVAAWNHFVNLNKHLTKQQQSDEWLRIIRESGKNQQQMSDLDWVSLKTKMRSLQPVESPIGDDQQFKDDDIPF